MLQVHTGLTMIVGMHVHNDKYHGLHIRDFDIQAVA